MGDWSLEAFAEALRGTQAACLLIIDDQLSPEEHVVVDLEFTVRSLMDYSPWLAAVGLVAAPAHERRAMCAPVASDDLSWVHSPDGIVLRTGRARLALGSMEGNFGDPGLEIMERLIAAGAPCDWRWAPIGRRRQVPGLPVSARSKTWGFDLGLADASSPTSREEDLGGDGWVGIARRGEHGPLEAIDAAVNADVVFTPVADIIEQPVAERDRIIYPRGEGEARPTTGLGYAQDFGLPGGVPLMRFHHDELNIDCVGIAGEDHPGGRPSLMLGWGRRRADGLRADVPVSRPGRIELEEHPRDGWVAKPHRPDRMRAAVAVLLRHARYDTRPVYAWSHRGEYGLTATPSLHEGADIRAIGHCWIAPDIGRVQLVDASDSVLGYVEGPPSLGLRMRPAFDAHYDGVGVADIHPDDSRLRRAVRKAGATAPGTWVRERRGAARANAMEVLLVLPWFTQGGADTFLYGLVTALQNRGYSFHALLTHTEAESPPDNTEAFIPLLASVTRPRDETPSVAVDVAIRDVVRREGVGQVILCGGWHAYEALPRLRRALPGVRFHDVLFNDVGHLERNRRAAPWLDITTCAYASLEAMLTEWFAASPGSTRLAYIGIDVDRFRPLGGDDRRELRRDLGLDPDRPIWGYSGRFSEEKRIDDFIRAVDLLPDSVDAQFLVQGDGPSASTIRALAEGAKREVIVRPFAEDPVATLQCLDAYVLPSRIEGIPLAIMEAVACGAVPIASAVGGVPEVVIPGRTGYLTRPLDSGSIAAALLALFETPPNVRAAMARAGRELVAREMSWQRTVDIYAEVLAGR